MASAFYVQLATPVVGSAGSPAAAVTVVDPGPRLNVSVVQNYRQMVDRLKKLRESSEVLAAGIWG